MAETLSTGSKIGPYTLLFRLGKGGMGEVWCATSGGQLQKLVALKLLLGAEEGSNSSVMFFDEARTAAALQHASIVPTIDLGQEEDTYYLAMDMIRGPSLTSMLQRLAVEKKMMPPAIVAYIGTRIASALDYANARAEINGQKLNLIHRDISPHNVLLDEHGNILLSDFGVARTDIQDHLSRAGTVRGKPSYMAPEQVTSSNVDGRTDVFALGTVLYETACVKRLFGRGNPLKSMEAVLKYEPKPLIERVPGFPKELANVIHKALQKKPENRFQSAREMVEALEESTRKMKGASTVTRDLTGLVNEVFPVGSFDVKSKADEALAQIGELTASEAPIQPQDIGEEDHHVPTAFSEGLGTHVGWPVAPHAADPLAPEALQEIEMQRAQERMLIAPPRTGNSMPGLAYPTDASVSGMLPQPVAPRSNAVLYAGITATIVAVLAVGLVASGALRKNDGAPVVETNPVPTASQPVEDKKLGVVAGKAPARPVERAPEKPTADKRRPSKPRSKTPARTLEKSTPRKATPKPAATPTPKPRSSGDPFAGPATKSKVYKCGSALKKKTGNSRILVGYSTAGDDPQTLKRLLDQCRAALK